MPALVKSAIDFIVAKYEDEMKPYIGQLPPSRGRFDHSIDLINKNVRPRSRRPIPLNARHQDALARELARLQAAGLI
jgi:hypothetical protein